MRLLIDGRAKDAGALAPAEIAASEVTAQDLAEIYRPQPGRWVRANMVASVDGAATGADGKSGSLNNAADKLVFDTLRAQADVIVVGAATARAERYHPAEQLLVVVSRSGVLPERLAESLAETPTATHGGVRVVNPTSLADLLDELVAQGRSNVLCEGGPHLLGDLLAEGLLDELCSTTTPQLVGGAHGRITAGAEGQTSLKLHTLIEAEGTLLARWLVERPEPSLSESSS